MDTCKSNKRISKYSQPSLSVNGPSDVEHSTINTPATSEEGRYPRRSIPRVNYQEEDDLPHDCEISEWLFVLLSFVFGYRKKHSLMLSIWFAMNFT